MSRDDQGYIDYFGVLGLPHDCKPGEVRREYRQKMKDLLVEISRAQLTDEARDRYLLEMAKLNAAFVILRDAEQRARYEADRERVIALEAQFRGVQDLTAEEGEQARRAFDAALRDFLGKYMEERMVEAGRDAECVEASHWDLAHERHATRVLRHFRQRLYHEVHERLPFYDVTPPRIDWDERARAVAALVSAGGR